MLQTLIKNGNAMLSSSTVMTSVKKPVAAMLQQPGLVLPGLLRPGLLRRGPKQFAKQFLRGLVMLGFCALGNTASADTIFGLHGSAHLWQPELGGTIGQNTNAFDFSSSFSGGEGDSTSLLVAVEHPIPLIPNLQLRNTPVTWSGSSDSASGTLLGTITITGEVDAEFDLTSLDGTLYYEVLDNWVSLDLGLTARRIDGFIAVSQEAGLSDRVNIDEVLPMGYAHARFDLPFTGLSVGARGNLLALGDNTLTDIEAYVQLEFDLIPLLDVGIQGGFRRLGLEIDDIDDFESDAVLDGAYIALTGHF